MLGTELLRVNKYFYANRLDFTQNSRIGPKNRQNMTLIFSSLKKPILVYISPDVIK